MSVPVDYYELLGVARSASEDEIREAHKRQVRIWTKRTASSDQSLRQEAETKTSLLRKALETLLDAQMRQSYDAELARGGVVAPAGAPVPAGSSGTNDWVQQARDALARADYHSAAYAAREATHTIGNEPDAWILRSRANAGLGNLSDALYEARQAVTIAPNNADYHFQTGVIHEELKDWERALDSYQTAARLDSDAFVYPLAVGSVLLQNGLVDEALQVIEPVHRNHPDVEIVTYYLANALLDKAETIPAVQTTHAYSVTQADEITQMRALVNRAAGLQVPDKDITDRVAHMTDYLDRTEAMTWSVPGLLGYSSLRAVGIPLVMLVIAFVLFGNGAAGIGFLFLLGAAGFGFLVYKISWVPQWKANQPGR